MVAGAAAESRGHAPLLSIGQVLARLSPDYPELTPSKLRFLEEQGLITPARTESGYRKFCEADLERLRLILSLQRDHYLPLKVIRAYVTDLDAGRNPAFPGQVQGASMLGVGRRMPREELLREAGASASLLDEAVAASLIVPADAYNDDALAVLQALVGLRRAGIEPRHLRGLRAAADRESALISAALAPALRRREASSKASATERGLEIAGQLETVRSSLIRGAIGRLAR
ncbi:transcriptional regulator FtsR [Agromyces atrinae]|uniref:transcriptional regulator FtsR n=1 Tax=Agromyces atrinae TaxID=592376 RepID=UPI00358DD2F1